jgi:hypothetical protein
MTWEVCYLGKNCTFSTVPTINTPAIIFCSSFHLRRVYRQSPRPPCVRWCFRLWLPVLRNSAQYFAAPHFLFSSSGSRSRWEDFNPGIDIIILFPMSCLLSFSLLLHGSPPDCFLPWQETVMLISLCGKGQNLRFCSATVSFLLAKRLSDM